MNLPDVNLGDQYDIPGYSQSEHPIIFFDYLSFSGNQVVFSLFTGGFTAGLSYVNLPGRDQLISDNIFLS